MRGISAMADGLIVTQTPHALVATLNRPRALNALTEATFHQLRQAIDQTGARTFVLQGSGKCFCAGGDIIQLAKRPETCSTFFPAEFALQRYLSQQKFFSVVLMKGATIGGGAGLSIPCRARVALESTLWAFPETVIGFVPTVGANYMFARLRSKAEGLYLALTGDQANGADCYSLGIATHYIKEEQQSALIKALSESSNPSETLSRFHQQPDFSLCQVLKHEGEIEACFSNISSIKELLSRLQALSSPWAVQTLSTLNFVCPLALKVALRQFHLCSSLSYLDCLDAELPILLQMTTGQNVNFLAGVHHRIISKNSSRPKWSPSVLAEVTEAAVAQCLVERSRTIGRL